MAPAQKTNEQYLDIITYNKNALNNLRRAVTLGQGQFSLILARVNYQRLRRVLIIELGVNLRLHKVSVPAAATNLREVIESETPPDLFSNHPSDLPHALMVTGLENVSHHPVVNPKDISSLEQLLKTANLGRDELPKRFPYPVVLWVNDTVLRHLNRYAPDLKSFSATPIRFEYPAPSLITLLRRQAADTFTQILDKDKGIVLSTHLPLSESISEPLAARELTFAITQLEHLPDNQADLVTNSLLADLLFLQGRSLHQQGDLIRARSYYEKSLVHWQLEAANRPINQTSTNQTTSGSLKKSHLLHSRDKQAVLRFHLGLWWRTQATLEKESTPAYQQARAYFESCLTIFRQQNRSDRVARFILALADVVQKLEDWPALVQVAKEGTRLHQSDPARLARDYGYLAEASLAYYLEAQAQGKDQPEQLSKAQGFAQQALEISEKALIAQTVSSDFSSQFSVQAVAKDLENDIEDDIEADESLDSNRSVSQQASESQPVRSQTAESQIINNQLIKERSLASQIALRYHRGCYFYLLAIAYQLQNQANTAIDYLQRTLQNVDPHYDLSLYRRSLSRLWQLYYDHKHYAEAFEIKLEQRRVETLFGLRAFIGASQIQPPALKAPYDELVEAGVAPAVGGIGDRTPLAAAIEASGRTEDIEALVSRLSQPRYTLVVVHGQSGVGKSSILKAGLVPHLHRSISEGRTALPILVSSYSNWISKVYSGLSLPELAPSSPSLLLETIQRLTQKRYQQIVLIFDQFEDFFYEYPTLAARQPLYSFLRDCLELPYVKVVLSLREDFLHYLLEWDRNADLSIINNDILSKEIRYYLGNFTPKAAEKLIHRLTQKSGFELAPDLVTALVDDLTADSGEVRPIELQVVGAQLQRENITTLAQYSQLGRMPKSQLLKNFLDSVVQDCGPENSMVARSVLYLLSEGETRPLKSLSELQEPLLLAHIESAPRQIGLVLDILIGSGLVFEVPEVSGFRYQLVHEYLASLVQDQQQPGLIEVLQSERNRRQLAEDQLQKALAAQSDTLIQATLARQKAKVSEIKALISVAQSLYLSGDGIGAMVKGLRAARQVRSLEDPLLKMQAALCLETSVRNIHERNELVGHRNWVLAVSCNPNAAVTESIVSASEDNTLKLWTSSGELLQTLTGHEAGVLDVCFSPDGRYLVSAGLDYTIRLWRLGGESDDGISGECIKEISLTSASVTGVSFSSDVDKPLIAATYSDMVVRLWSLEGELVRSLEGHEDWVRSVAFSPDGSRLVTGAEDNTVRIWSVDGELLDTLRGHRGWVRSVAFSPDGRLIASAGDATAIRLWSAEGYKLSTFYGHEDWIRSVAFSPNGQYLASASDDQTIRIWTLNGNVVHVFNHRSSVHSVAWSADSQSVVSGGDDDQVHIWRLQGPKLPICVGHEGIVWSARWRPVAEESVGREILEKKKAEKEKLEQTEDKTKQAGGRQIDKRLTSKPSQTHLTTENSLPKILSSGGDAEIKLWAESGVLLRSIATHKLSVHCADWRPCGQFFASASADYSVKIWRADGALVRTLAGHGDAVWQVRYSPDGQRLVSVSSDRTVRLWSHKGNLLKTWSDHTDTVWHANFSPDGQYVISASEDNTLRLWHVEHDLVQTIKGPTGGQLGSPLGGLWCVTFDPQGRFVAAGGADGVIRLWSVIPDKQIGQMRLAPNPTLLRGHRDWTRSVCFSPDGQFLASASDDGSIRLWSMSAEILADSQEEGGMAQLLPPLLGHKGVVWDVDFDETGERLVSAGADGTIRVWELQLDRLMAKGYSWLQDWLLTRPQIKEQIYG